MSAAPWLWPNIHSADSNYTAKECYEKNYKRNLETGEIVFK